MDKISNGLTVGVGNFKIKNMEKHRNDLIYGKDANKELQTTLKFLRDSVKCENCNDDIYDENIYNVVVENMLLSGVCSGFYNHIDDKVTAVIQEHCKKIGVKTPQIDISHFPFENRDKYVFGRANPSNKVSIRVGEDENVCQNEEEKESCLNATFAEVYSNKKLKIASEYLNKNAINETSYVYSVVLHELTHIKQYAIIKDCANGVFYSPYFDLLSLYATMRVANCKMNGIVNSIYYDMGYVYSILEVDARINTIEMLSKMYLNTELNESCRQRILEALKLAIYEELILVKNFGVNYNKLVKEQLNKSKMVFSGYYGKTELGQQIIEDYTKTMQKSKVLENVKDFDKNLMRCAKFVAEQESITKFGKIAQTALDGRMAEIEDAGMA